MSSTFALIPGAGGATWYWSRVVPLLRAAGHRAIAVDLPAADPAAGLPEYADAVGAAVSGVDGPLVLVGQSMGAYTAPVVATRVPTRRIVLVNPMVPAPGESPGQWWAATGQDAASAAYLHRIGLGRNTFDHVEDFFHDVPAAVRAEAFRGEEPRQADTPFGQPWPLRAWPDVPTSVIVGRDDRLFPLDFQRRVVRDRLGLDVEVMPGGHLMALSQPRELARLLLAHGN